MSPSTQETDLAKLEQEHTPEAIRRRLSARKPLQYLGDAVLGAVDGCITTFAIVTGVLGGGLSSNVAIILGFANLVADGFSMAVSNFERARSNKEWMEKTRRIEEHHVAQIPEGEREEIRQIYLRKGFKEPALSRLVELITQDKKLWVDTMVMEEWGLPLEGTVPWKSAAATFLAFLAVGSIPLLPFLLLPGAPQDHFWQSALFTLVAFFSVGSLKGKILDRPWLSGGLRTAFLGGLAALLALGVGYLLRGIADKLIS